MTQIVGTLNDSAGNGITGKLIVVLAGSLIDDTTSPDTIYLPQSYTFTITAGALDITLPQSETSRITYNFQFFKTNTDGSLIEPALNNFNALVPNLSPVQFASLTPTGITNDVLDTGALRTARLIASTPALAQSIGGPFPQGVYNPSTTYKFRDLVTYLNRTYISKDLNPITGVVPTNTISWMNIPIEPNGSLLLGDATPYGTSWNGSGLAASQNSIYDEIESVKADVALKSNIISPIFTEDVIVPDQTAGNNSTRAANTKYVDAGLALKANLASPTLTGTPITPTASQGTNNTQIASTAFVQQVNRPCVFADVSSALTQTASSLIISFSSESIDSNNAFSGTTFTVPIAGIYQISGLISLSNNDTSTRQFRPYLLLNGSPFRQLGSMILNAGQGNSITLASLLIPCSVSQTLQIRLDVYTGLSVPFTVYGAGSSFINIFRLAA
ncbi:hypothetical protein [Nostoc sp. ChiQUE01b]|uniref:hypothetical protein n=1 Tax=Nostoc sp. ChiQUE01b TaxID=3075376 RepID=UPI002AD51F95|nr:hypothetical protein [Nostoc sp. ChiQUE01b]MDZ8259446.1 hypothetical protein [Nostoc sp. ChiQUE01b]